MKKKHFKVIALTIAILLIIGLGIFANALLGNPISKKIATNTAQKHLAETYADTDYYMERITYSFKDGKYHAFIKSPTSIDTSFSLTITMLGELRLIKYALILLTLVVLRSMHPITYCRWEELSLRNLLFTSA